MFFAFFLFFLFLAGRNQLQRRRLGVVLACGRGGESVMNGLQLVFFPFWPCAEPHLFYVFAVFFAFFLCFLFLAGRIQMQRRRLGVVLACGRGGESVMNGLQLLISWFRAFFP